MSREKKINNNKFWLPLCSDLIFAWGWAGSCWNSDPFVIILFFVKIMLACNGPLIFQIFYETKNNLNM